MERTEMKEQMVVMVTAPREEDRTVKSAAESDSAPPAGKTLADSTFPESYPSASTLSVISGPTLLGRVHMKQRDFRLRALYARATSEEDMKRGWTAHIPSVYYTEPQDAAARHVTPCLTDPLKVPSWVVALFNKMKDRKKSELTYLPVEKEMENSDQLLGRTNSLPLSRISVFC